LVVINQSQKRRQIYEASSKLDKQCAINFVQLKNQEFLPISDKPHGRMILKLLGRWTCHRRKFFPREKRIGLKVSFKAKGNHMQKMHD